MQDDPVINKSAKGQCICPDARKSPSKNMSVEKKIFYI